MSRKEEALAKVQSALEVLERKPEYEDEEGLTAMLRAADFEQRDADCLAALLPIAFGRAMLQKLGVTAFRDDALVSHPDGSKSWIFFSDQPLYVAAVQIAVQALHHGTPTPSTAQRLTNWGSELKAFAPAIQAGQPIDGRVASTTLFYGYEKNVFNKPPWWRRRLF
jgi:hypothetical protein